MEHEHQLFTELHNNYALYTSALLSCASVANSNTPIRMMELEWYPLDDPFTHGNELQHRESGFYVHRTGKSSSSAFKAGSFCGIDICMCGGMLIRSIEVDGEIVEGPCLVVNRLMEISGWSKSQLESHLQLAEYTWPHRDPMFGARGGLTLKKQDPSTACYYWVLPRRSAIFIPKKYRECWFATDINRRDIITRSTSKYQQEFASKIHTPPTRNSTLLEVAGYLSHIP